MPRGFEDHCWKNVVSAEALSIEECTFDRHLLSHKVNLFDMHHKYADVMHVEEAVAHLNRLVGLRRAG